MEQKPGFAAKLKCSEIILKHANLEMAKITISRNFHFENVKIIFETFSAFFEHQKPSFVNGLKQSFVQLFYFDIFTL